MTESTMPTTDAVASAPALDDELASYELAFHILPTVVEGEVADVVASLKDAITAAGGTVTDEEVPERIELAYEVIKYVEGKHRRFHSAYFGWVRFTATPDAIAAITEAVESNTSVLRHLLIRLTALEEANPFWYHEAQREVAQVTNIDEADMDTEADAPSESSNDGEDASHESNDDTDETPQEEETR